jgi:hypothetical protein
MSSKFVEMGLHKGGDLTSADPTLCTRPLKVEEKVPGILWGPGGALCIRHVRVPDLGSLVDLVASCPRLKSIALGGACQETAPGILLRKDVILSTYCLL